MRLGFILTGLLFGMMSGQVFELDMPVSALYPVGDGGMIAVSSILETDSTATVSRISPEADVCWTVSIPVHFVECIHVQDSSLVIGASIPYGDDPLFYLAELSMLDGQLIRHYSQEAGITGFPEAFVVLDNDSLLLLADSACYALSDDLSMDYLFSMPSEIDRVIGAALMADGSLEIAGTFYFEQYYLFWMDDDFTLIDIWDGGLVSSASYSVQPGFRSILGTVDWPYLDSPVEHWISVRSLLEPPGDRLFIMNVGANCQSCIDDDGYLTIVQVGSARDFSSLSVEKYDSSGSDVCSNELFFDLGEYLYIRPTGIVRTESGYAVACQMGGGPQEDRYLLLLLDELGMLPGQSGGGTGVMGAAVYPNPFSVTATLEINPGDIGTVSVSIVDISGRRVGSMGPSQMGGSFSYEIGDLPAGVYLVGILFRPEEGDEVVYSLRAVCTE